MHHGAVVLDLILSLPILFIALLVVVEFGLVMANLKQVALASREGAKIAAESMTLDVTTAATIRAEVDDRLQSAGFGPSASRGVTLRHTVSGSDSFTDGACADPTTPTMPSGAVRVTVCVELTKLTPNLLNAFGFDVTGKVVEHTTTLRHEP